MSCDRRDGLREQPCIFAVRDPLCYFLATLLMRECAERVDDSVQLCLRVDIFLARASHALDSHRLGRVAEGRFDFRISRGDVALLFWPNCFARRPDAFRRSSCSTEAAASSHDRAAAFAAPPDASFVESVQSRTSDTQASAMRERARRFICAESAPRPVIRSGPRDVTLRGIRCGS